CIDEHEVKCFTEPGHDFQCLATLNAHARAHSGARQEAFSRVDHFVTWIDSNYQTFSADGTREMNRGVADRHSDLQRALGFDASSCNLDKPRYFAIRTGNVMLRAILFHFR